MLGIYLKNCWFDVLIWIGSFALQTIVLDCNWIEHFFTCLYWIQRHTKLLLFFLLQMDTIALPPTVTFKMGECKLYFGGVPPDFETSDFENLKFGHLLGSLRGITISNPGSNSLLSPLYTQRFQPNPFYGVEQNCERKVASNVFTMFDFKTSFWPLSSILIFHFSNSISKDCIT